MAEGQNTEDKALPQLSPKELSLLAAFFRNTPIEAKTDWKTAAEESGYGTPKAAGDMFNRLKKKILAGGSGPTGRISKSPAKKKASPNKVTPSPSKGKEKTCESADKIEKAEVGGLVKVGGVETKGWNAWNN